MGVGDIIAGFEIDGSIRSLAEDSSYVWCESLAPGKSAVDSTPLRSNTLTSGASGVVSDPHGTTDEDFSVLTASSVQGRSIFLEGIRNLAASFTPATVAFAGMKAAAEVPLDTASRALFKSLESPERGISMVAATKPEFAEDADVKTVVAPPSPQVHGLGALTLSLPSFRLVQCTSYHLSSLPLSRAFFRLQQVILWSGAQFFAMKTLNGAAE